jgi:Peptidase A4 family
MNMKALTPVLMTAAVGALGALPPSAGAATDVQQAASGNWSGYVASSTGGKHFTSVSGAWTQPTANCTSGSGYAAFWVGLGGSRSSSSSGSDQNQALEQAGTEADCSSGQAKYFAWYELVPAAPVKLGLTINPGDRITTRVGVSGNTVTIYLLDVTSGQSVSKTLTMNNPDTSSAEWIAEAPSSCGQDATSCSPLPLTNFGTVKFSGATATASDGHTGPVSDSDWTTTQVVLQNEGGGSGAAQFATDTGAASAGAAPSSLSADGESFSVAWSDGSAATSSTGGDGAAYGYGGGSGDSGSYGYPGGAYAYPGDGYSGGYGGGSSDGYVYGYGDPGGYGYYGGGYAYSY